MGHGSHSLPVHTVYRYALTIVSLADVAMAAEKKKSIFFGLTPREPQERTHKEKLHDRILPTTIMELSYILWQTAWFASWVVSYWQVGKLDGRMSVGAALGLLFLPCHLQEHFPEYETIAKIGVLLTPLFVLSQLYALYCGRKNAADKTKGTIPLATYFVWLLVAVGLKLGLPDDDPEAHVAEANTTEWQTKHILIHSALHGAMAYSLMLPKEEKTAEKKKA